MKTKLQQRKDEESKVYKRICGILNLARAEKEYGIKTVKWAMNRFIKGTSERAKLLKARAEAERRIAEIDKMI
jgi:hypothetical protein